VKRPDESQTEFAIRMAREEAQREILAEVYLAIESFSNTFGDPGDVDPLHIRIRIAGMRDALTIVARTQLTLRDQS
jgi:hypothetical protein